MFTLCDVLHETKQSNANKLSRVRSTDWKSSLTIGIIYRFLEKAKGFPIPRKNMSRKVKNTP